MKVSELIGELNKMPQDAEVVYAYDSGIRHPVEMAIKFDGKVVVSDCCELSGFPYCNADANEKLMEP